MSCFECMYASTNYYVCFYLHEKFNSRKSIQSCTLYITCLLQTHTNVTLELLHALTVEFPYTVNIQELLDDKKPQKENNY